MCLPQLCAAAVPKQCAAKRTGNGCDGVPGIVRADDLKVFSHFRVELLRAVWKQAIHFDLVHIHAWVEPP